MTRKIICIGMICVSLIAMMIFSTDGLCEEEGFDSSVIDILWEFKCPVEVFSFGYTLMESSFGPMDGRICYTLRGRARDVTYTDNNEGDYSVILDSELVLIESQTIDEETYELYKGTGGGYLALVRRGDAVRCVQYINDYDSAKYFEESVLVESVYSHRVESNTNMLQYGYTEQAYFLDGTRVILVYSYNSDDTKYHDTETCILSRLDSHMNEIESIYEEAGEGE